MDFLLNWGLRTRLLVGFALTLSLCIIGSAFSVKELGIVEKDVDYMVTDDMAKVELNQQMSEAVHVVSRVVRTVVLLEDPNLRAAEAKKITAARQSYDQAWATLSQMPGSERGLAQRKKIDAARAEARPLNDKVLALVDTFQVDQAVRVLMQEAGPATQRWQDALDESIALQSQSLKQTYAETQAAMAVTRWTLIGLTALSVVLGVGIALVITRSATVPLQAAVAFADQVAQGDLTNQADVQGRDEVARLRQALRDMQTALSGIVSQVRDNASQLAAASEQIAGGNHDLSQRTEEQASSLEQTAASMEQLSATVRQNAQSADEAHRMAQNASEVARNGGELVSEVVQTMRGISDSSRQIGDIIGVIDSIAFQTNILALNAAVEAARAGEAGRGFAVVASEVRSLAGRSAGAAREIKTLIQASLERVEQGNVQVERAGQTMQDVVTSIEQVNAIVGDITRASVEQSEGVSQVGQAVSQLDQATQQNAALVEEMASAAEKLNQQAGELVQAVAVFKLA